MRLLNTIAFISLLSVTTIAQAAIKLTVTPAALNFGSVAVGSTSASQGTTAGFTFDGVGSGNGNADRGTIDSISITNPVGGTFNADQSCVGTRFDALALGTTCIIQVECTPSAVGNISADLDVLLDLDSGGSDTQTVTLSCAGVIAPTPGSTAIPTIGFYGIGVLSMLLAACGAFGMRGRKST